MKAVTKTRRLTLLGAALVAPVVLLAAAPFASAGTSATAYTRANGAYASSAGSAHFQEYGDVFTVSDNKSDGKAVILFLEINGKTSNLWPPMYFSRGAGYTGTWDEELAEGTKISMEVCLASNPTTSIPGTCSGWVSAVA